MGTKCSVVYDAFLNKIKDYEFGELEYDVMDYDLRTMLAAAVTDFHICVSSLEIKGEGEKAAFSADLTDEEIQILATLMKREWFRRVIADTDVLLQKFGEADFEFKSQASHLNALNKTEVQLIDKEVKKKLSYYSRIKSGEVFNYGKLAGKNS